MTNPIIISQLELNTIRERARTDQSHLLDACEAALAEIEALHTKLDKAETALEGFRTEAQCLRDDDDEAFNA